MASEQVGKRVKIWEPRTMGVEPHKRVENGEILGEVIAWAT
jgi:hypothetical protein